MNVLQRLKNLWALGGALQAEPETFYDHTPQMQETRVTPPPPSKSQKVFIPRVTKDPVRAITEEQDENN